MMTDSSSRKKVLRIAIFFVATVLDLNSTSGTEQRTVYDDHQLIVAKPKDDYSKNALNFHINGESTECDFLRAPRIHTQPSQILCPSEETSSKLAEKLRSLDIEHEVWKGFLNPQKSISKRETRSTSITDFEHYPRFDEIEAYLRQNANDYPSFVKMSIKGKTTENRNMIVMKLGNSPKGSETPAVWFDAGIHAREWVSPTSGIYTIEQIIQNHINRTNGDLFNEDVVAVDWYIMPLLNPDGYEYSHTNDRMWRKNRTPDLKGSSCYGVDLMRNFDVAGYGVGASSNPCRETYQGIKRNSEIETRIASKEILDHQRNIRVALSLHSIGQSWLTSWGYRYDPPLDNEELLKWGNEAAAAIKSLHGTRYEVGSAGGTLYLAGGAIDDFSKSVAKIPYVATVELSGTNSDGYGFMMPEKYIRRIGEEMWEGMKVSAKYARNSALGPSKTAKAEEVRERMWLSNNPQ